MLIFRYLGKWKRNVAMRNLPASEVFISFFIANLVFYQFDYQTPATRDEVDHISPLFC
jgi:hypothetical protein